MDNFDMDRGLYSPAFQCDGWELSPITICAKIQYKNCQQKKQYWLTIDFQEYMSLFRPIFIISFPNIMPIIESVVILPFKSIWTSVMFVYVALCEPHIQPFRSGSTRLGSPWPVSALSGGLAIFLYRPNNSIICFSCCDTKDANDWSFYPRKMLNVNQNDTFWNKTLPNISPTYVAAMVYHFYRLDRKGFFIQM